MGSRGWARALKGLTMNSPENYDGSGDDDDDDDYDPLFRVYFLKKVYILRGEIIRSRENRKTRNNNDTNTKENYSLIFLFFCVIKVTDVRWY